MHRYRLCEKWGGIPPSRVAPYVDGLQALYRDMVAEAEAAVDPPSEVVTVIGEAVAGDVERALASVPAPLRAEAASLPRAPVVQWTLPSGKRVRVMLAQNPPSAQGTVRSSDLVVEGLQPSDHPPTTDVSDVIPKTQAWFRFLDMQMERLPRDYHQRRCSGDLFLYLFLTDVVKKGVPEGQSPLGPTHVNSGFTYACAPTNQICIFRYEEWWKVLMHESIHAYGLDFAWAENASMARPLQRAFPGVHCDNWRISESWTECWAEILVLLHHIYWTTKKRDWKDVRFLVHCGLYYEAVWSRSQCTKILHLGGLTYTQLLEKGQDRMYQEPRDAPAVFSYYVLKCIAMNHLEGFLGLSAGGSPWEKFARRATVGDAARDYVAFLVQHAADPGDMTAHHDADASLRMSLWGGV